jgi:branched-chain amino acid transport system substrate-binding protein
MPARPQPNSRTPDESKGQWDVFRLVGTIPGDQAFRPPEDGGCPLVTKQN